MDVRIPALRRRTLRLMAPFIRLAPRLEVVDIGFRYTFKENKGEKERERKRKGIVLEETEHCKLVESIVLT